MTELKELKRYAKKIYQITKNKKYTIKDKTDKNLKNNLEQRIVLAPKIILKILGNKK